LSESKGEDEEQQPLELASEEENAFEGETDASRGEVEGERVTEDEEAAKIAKQAVASSTGSWHNDIDLRRDRDASFDAASQASSDDERRESDSSSVPNQKRCSKSNLLPDPMGAVPSIRHSFSVSIRSARNSLASVVELQGERKGNPGSFKSVSMADLSKDLMRHNLLDAAIGWLDTSDT
jgi:hypothetical protein